MRPQCKVGLDLEGASRNLDSGFDSKRNRQCIFNAGLIPNTPKNPRSRKGPKRGRKQRFKVMAYTLINLRAFCGV
jgi:hypothetical protein